MSIEGAPLVAIEGIDGAGKTTLTRGLEGVRNDVFVTGEMRSPLGPILGASLATLTPEEKVYWFAADRVSILAEARQRVASGARLIVWDRYVDSARVYRAAEVELGLAPLALLELVETINADFPTPDLTIYLDVDVETAKRRLLEREGKPDPRLPLALAGYRRLAENNENYVVLAARRAKDEVLADVAMLLEGLLS